ncbi:uroporphyrinogen-III C-methyltransferase, partial [Thioclava sp. BHET1]
MSGFVSFVSSGPGDPELLTLKAVNRIAAADAVLFDDLSSGPILAHARADADLVGVGKRAGRASPKQDQVSRLLVDYAKTGAKVVRLKSGDAGLFGRLEEEITALREAGIGFEIIPGVPSACAAAAAAGIPLTRRVTARRVQFVTGHDVTGGLPEGLNMAALADPVATTVVFMGKR